MKKIKHKLFNLLFAIPFFLCSEKVQAQNQGLYIDTIKWPNTNSITLNVRAKSFTNVLNFQGTINWNKNSLQWVSVTGNAAFSSLNNYQFGTGTAVSQGILTYLFSDAAANHTVANGTILFSINFNVINNPSSTYPDNVVTFANTPTQIGIDTAADIAGLSDYASLLSPNLERHIKGYISFARTPVLSYTAGTATIADSVTNRPVGCSYQWLKNNVVVTGAPNASTYPNAPTGSYVLKVTYPNSTVVTSNTVLPVSFTKFTGKSTSSTNQLDWSTAHEVNTNYFEIERSNNGKDFISIGRIIAKGNSSMNQDYTYIDFTSNTSFYYRLKINDNDGSYTYSNIIKIAKAIKSVISVYPNPAKELITITGESMNGIVITNLLGKIVLQKEMDEINVTILSISNLLKGVYYIKVQSKEGYKITQFIKD